MAPVIIAALISAAASKVKSNQANAMKMNEGNKTGGTYQISSGEGNGGQSNAYRPSEQQVNTGGNGGELAGFHLRHSQIKFRGSDDEGGEAVFQGSAEGTGGIVVPLGGDDNFHFPGIFHFEVSEGGEGLVVEHAAVIGKDVHLAQIGLQIKGQIQSALQLVGFLVCEHQGGDVGIHVFTREVAVLPDGVVGFTAC